MKKIIIGLSGIVLVAFIVILFTSASTGDPVDAKKAATEVSIDCSKCPSAATCADKEEAKTAEAKPCAAAAACKTPCAVSAEAKKCDEVKPCCAAKK